MTYPNYPPAPQPQYASGYPPAPQPQYAPGYGQYPPPGIQYAPQGYAPPPGPAAPLARGTIDDFYEQPTGGSGRFVSYKDRYPGWKLSGFVARDVTHADIRQQTNMRTREGLKFPDGRPKFEMLVPLLVAPSPDHPDGRATWCVKGRHAAELKRAVGEAGGDPNQPPPAGARIDITYLGREAVPGMNDAHVIQVTYTPPEAAGPMPAPAPAQPSVSYGTTQPQQLAPVGQAPVQPAYGNGQYGDYQQQQYQAPPAQYVPNGQQANGYAPNGQYAPQPQFQAPPNPPVPTPSATAPAPGPAGATAAPPATAADGPQPPASLSPDQAELLRKLTGG